MPTVSVATGENIAGSPVKIQILADIAVGAAVLDVIVYFAGAGGRVAGFEIAAERGADLGLVQTQAGGGIDAGKDRTLVVHAGGVGEELGAPGGVIHTLVGGQIAVAVGVVDIAAGDPVPATDALCRRRCGGRHTETDQQ